MKIHLDNVNLGSRTGPNSFALRFVNQVKEMGHDVVENGKDADVSLVFIERTGKPLANKIVQRLDGIWFSPDQFYTHNTNIKKTYDQADHVIWQSEFDRTMVTKWWSLPKSGSVIRNGASSVFEKDEKLEEQLKTLKNKHEKIFVCSANWHPQKRLRSNVELFLHLKRYFYPTACLVVMGSNPEIIREIPDLYFTGSLPHNFCMQVYEACDWMFHLAWLDHCPNTVVEALACNTPVICSEDGGTKELVGNFGIILKEKSQYQYDLVDYDDPPEIDVGQLIKPLISKELLKIHDISIESSVKSYLNVFESLIH